MFLLGGVGMGGIGGEWGGVGESGSWGNGWWWDGWFLLGFTKQNGEGWDSVRVVCKRHPCRTQTNCDIPVTVTLVGWAFC